MCGLTGFWNLHQQDITKVTRIAEAMAGQLSHRGPDGHGVWVAEGLALAHRRLAILDLSEAGHQPMISACGRYIIVLNGEIYNHPDLRAELEIEGVAAEWRGHSDTETLLAGIAHWGLEATLKRATGMFALALWDRKARCLYLARDRFGEKPLYYGWAGQTFVFGSELKALRVHPDFAAKVCREALAQYLRFTYIPAPRSIYRGIFKLEPGCILAIDGAPPEAAPEIPVRPGARFGTLSISRYWSLGKVIESGAHDPIHDENEGLNRLEAVLGQAVRQQLTSDVPLGAFLSGGVDSSTIVALMRQHASGPVKTFTVGFAEAGFDESPHARAVARHLGTEHTELMVAEAETRAVIPALPELYDEPFADSSQIPTHLVCRAARAHVTVALSGDAGDELFGGYNRYFWGPRIWNRLAWIPFPLRRVLGKAMTGVSVAGWDRVGAGLDRIRPGTGGIARVGDKAQKLAVRLSHVKNMDDLYLSLVSEWRDPAALIRAEGGRVSEPESLLDDPLPRAGVETAQARMMFRDAMTYLPDDILCKVDRAAMGAGLETRAPFLDHHVAELAWQLPMSMKIRGNEGKWALRQILYRYVPRELIERPKAGFGIPVGQWLRGPLRDWAEALLDPRRLAAEGYLDSAQVSAIWQEHLCGRRDWTPRLWTILMFQAWLEAQG